MDAIKQGAYRRPEGAWEHIPDQARDLLEKLLEYDPDTRLSAEEALRHPWLQD